MNNTSNYVVKKQAKFQFYFELETPTNEIIGTSKIYQSKHKVYMAIAAVRANVLLSNFEYRIHPSKHYSFVVLSSKKEILLNSKIYTTTQQREQAHVLVAKYAPKANILERIYK